FEAGVLDRGVEVEELPLRPFAAFAEGDGFDPQFRDLALGRLEDDLVALFGRALVLAALEGAGERRGGDDQGAGGDGAKDEKPEAAHSPSLTPIPIREKGHVPWLTDQSIGYLGTTNQLRCSSYIA